MVLFPIALGVKTPIPFLVLSGVGAVALLRRAWHSRDWRPAGPAAAAALILLSTLPGRINLGIRHLLPIYPPLAVMAATGVLALARLPGRGRNPARLFALALVSWQVVASVRTHPDYLSDFNELAGRHPERVLLDSNLDWGQDLPRLGPLLRGLSVPSAALCYFGTADPRRFRLPPTRPLPPGVATTGWIVASEMCLASPGYEWLRDREGVARAGRSVRIFYVPPEGPAKGRATSR